MFVLTCMAPDAMFPGADFGQLRESGIVWQLSWAATLENIWNMFLVLFVCVCVFIFRQKVEQIRLLDSLWMPNDSHLNNLLYRI